MADTKTYLDQDGLKALITQIKRADNSVQDAAQKALNKKVGNLGNFETVQDYVDEKVENAESSAAADITYSNSNKTTIALGGISKGTTFENMKLKDIIEKMLYPYVEIQAGSLTINANKILEVGDSTTFSTAQVSYTKGSENCIKIEILNAAGETIGKLEGNNVSSNAKITLNAKQTVSVPASTGSSGSVTYKGRVTDAKNTSKNTSNVTFNFYRPYYVGTMAEIPTEESQIKGLTKNVAARPNSIDAVNKANKYWVIAYPATYSNIKLIKDANNFDVTGNIELKTMNITCLDSAVKEYKVYYGLKGTADAMFKVSFE